jgi:hypothetical protein
VWFEVQITSILRDAWSEIEHPCYNLKEALPPDIKRRFARMAALLEIAESEFLALRKDLVSPLTQSLYGTSSQTDSTLAEFDKQIADSWGATLEAAVPDSNLEPLSKAANAAGCPPFSASYEYAGRRRYGEISECDRLQPDLDCGQTS